MFLMVGTTLVLSDFAVDLPALGDTESAFLFRVDAGDCAMSRILLSTHQRFQLHQPIPSFARRIHLSVDKHRA